MTTPDRPATPITPARLRREFTEPLERWFAAHARDLPWRRTPSAYAALVAESMLQQTQVARVVEAFEAFMARFPTVHDLAAADEQDVLAMWQGLGYYRRARHLHGAARRIVDAHAGTVPADVDALLALPGVGRYTAGAVASIVFGMPAPIVDGNVQRVFARWRADDRVPSSRESIADAWALATAVVEASRHPGAVNEAMMELGATICTPRTPRCERCPLAGSCLARRQGRADELPRPKARARQTAAHHHALLVHHDGRVLVERRASSGMWSNMWQVPTIEADRPLSTRALRARVELPAGVMLGRLRSLEAFDHGTTHRAIRFHVFAAAATGVGTGGAWRSPGGVDDLPLSVPQRRILMSFAASVARGI